ncbi:MAG: phenylalanine--tRNA ligase subunit beta [Pyrobaculum sp.]
MPVVEVAKFDLERLTGLQFREVERLLEHVKCEIEEDLGDRLRLEVTHDRPDHFSAEGLAKTLKGVAGVETGLPKANFRKSSIRLVSEAIEERPYISMAVVKDVRLDDEAVRQLIQLQEKIHETYGRGRRKIAIGYYDVAKIRPPIYYRRISQDVEYVPLGFSGPITVREMYEKTEQGRKYGGLIRREEPPALVDSEGRVMVVVPVLGSECCKISESTRDVLIDVTGTELRAVTNAMSVLIYSLLERSISKEVEIVEGGNTYVHSYLRFELDAKRAGEVLGVELTHGEFVDKVRRARLDYDREVVAPPYRINLLSWVDVVEDVALMIGYNRLPREPPGVLSAGRRHKVEILTQDLRRLMLIMGFVEINNYVLTDRTVLDVCKAAYVINPISELYNAVRCSIITQLVATAATIRRKEVRIFEVGDVVRDGKTKKALAFLISRDGVTLTDGLSVVKTLCRLSGLSCHTVPASYTWALQNRAAEIRGDVEGYVGEVNPDLLTKLGHSTPTVVAELTKL